MTQEDQKKKRGPPETILPNKQILPLIAMGTYKVKEEETLTALLRKGLQNGLCRHIDTARMYNNQIALGKAIKTVISEGRIKRQELFIASKLMNQKNDSVEKQVKQILQLMQLKYIDLLYVHWPFPDMLGGQFVHKPLEQFWLEMERCVTKGYVKNLGISNFNGQMMMQLLSVAKIPPIALQIQLHPYLQQTNLVQLAQKNGINVFAYSPLLRADKLNKDGINIFQDDIILDIAAKHGKTPAQAILKSTLYRGIGVVPMTTNPARIVENGACWTVELGQDDMKKIRTLNKNYRAVDGKTLLTAYSNFE